MAPVSINAGSFEVARVYCAFSLPSYQLPAASHKLWASNTRAALKSNTVWGDALVHTLTAASQKLPGKPRKVSRTFGGKTPFDDSVTPP